MLVTRHTATEQSPWSKRKFETPFHKSSESLRMSNNFDAVTQSDWQGQYSFLPPGDNNIFSQPYENASSNENAETRAQPRSVTTPSIALDAEAPKPENSMLGHRLDPLGLRQPKHPSPIPEQPESQEEQYAQKTAESAHEALLVSTETPGLSLESNPLSSVSSAGQGSEVGPNHTVNEVQVAVKEEDEEVLEDEDMLEGEAEGETMPQPQTAAERTAQRRKMKRFRYETGARFWNAQTAANFTQAYPPADEVLDERIRKAATPRCGTPRTTLARDSWAKPSSSAGVVSEPVCSSKMVPRLAAMDG